MVITLFVLLGILLSIFFSSSEIALLSANKLQINVWNKQNKRLSKLANSIIENKEYYLFCILIGNNLANILTTSFLTIFLLRQKQIPENFIFIVIALIILLFAEIIPKSTIRKFSNISLLIFSPILYLILISKFKRESLIK